MGEIKTSNKKEERKLFIKSKKNYFQIKVRKNKVKTIKKKIQRKIE